MTFEEVQAYIEAENAKHTEQFVPVPLDEIKHWYEKNKKELPMASFRNNRFLVQLFREDHGVIRITVNTTRMVGWNKKVDGPEWDEGISWDDMQSIKHAMGYGHRDAVEVYPRDEDVVNVARMRHLFVLGSGHGLNFIWRKS